MLLLQDSYWQGCLASVCWHCNVRAQKPASSLALCTVALMLCCVDALQHSCTVARCTVMSCAFCCTEFHLHILLQMLTQGLGWPPAEAQRPGHQGVSDPPAVSGALAGPGLRPAEEELRAQLLTLQVVSAQLGCSLLFLSAFPTFLLFLCVHVRHKSHSLGNTQSFFPQTECTASITAQATCHGARHHGAAAQRVIDKTGPVTWIFAPPADWVRSQVQHQQPADTA